MRRAKNLLRTLSFVLAFIGLVMVVRRILAIKGLIPSFVPPGGEAFDGGFAPHPVITLLHILPGGIFMILGPLQFLPGLRTKHPRFHRRSGRVFLVAGFIVGLTALVMPFVMTPIGGVFGTAFWMGFSLHAIAAEIWINSTRKSLALA